MARVVESVETDGSGSVQYLKRLCEFSLSPCQLVNACVA